MDEQLEKAKAGLRRLQGAAVASFSKDEFIRYGAMTLTFWLSSVLFQGAAGLATVHSGRSGVVQMAIGSAGALVAASTSQMTSNAISHNRLVVNKFALKYDREAIRRLYVSVACFVVLEQLPFPFVLPFGTILPSSLLDKGVFARAGGSVPATAVAATDSERKATQRLGRWRGCHHCGGRVRQLVQPRGVALIGGMGYIADHMPPTKIARELSEVWWRRMLRITVKQRLYPQCKSCFSRQGEAVRSGTHTLVYHLGLRPCHFASAAALVLLSSSSGRDVNMHCARLEDTIIGAYRSVYKFFT